MEDVESCALCHEVMDVSAAAPFNRVICPSCEQEVRVKRQFGNYFLERRHAYGGMSVVFGARDLTLDREVAVKVLNDTYSGDEERAAKFETEAEQTARVSHPNVVRVYSVGRAHKRFYIAMELLEGTSLEERLEQGDILSEKEVLNIAVQVVEGLQAAHAAGLIHRDIKPGNILVDGEGVAKIVDFGLSLVTHGGVAQADELFATPYYASPEALEGKAEDLRSDIYALGATLYHSLTGVPPIETKSTSTRTLLEAKQHVVSPKAHKEELSHEVAEVVQKAMCFYPDGRYVNYEEFREALKDAKSSLESGVVPTEEFSERRRSGNGLILTLLGLVFLSAGLVFYSQKKTVEEVDAIQEQPALIPVVRDERITAVEVGRLYSEAKIHLGKKDYEQSELLFKQVLEAHNAVAETAVWSGYEASLAALLDGRSQDARVHIAQLEGFLETGELSAELRSRFEVAVKNWDGLERLPVNLSCPEDAELALLEFGRSLRNWEQGGVAMVSFFEDFQNRSFPGRGNWLQAYQQTASDILLDHRLLSENEPDWSTRTNDWEEVLRGLAQLNSELRTEGRARYIVESWQQRARALMHEKRAFWLEDEK